MINRVLFISLFAAASFMAAANSSGQIIIFPNTDGDGSVAVNDTSTFVADGTGVAALDLDFDEVWRNSDSQPRDVVVDDDGHIVAAGGTRVTRYGVDRIEQWHVNLAFDVRSVTVDAGNNIYVAGYSSEGSCQDILIEKIRPFGSSDWQIAIPGAANSCGTFNARHLEPAVSFDGSGTIYVAGYLENQVDVDPGPSTVLLSNSGSSDIFVARYNDAGEHLNSFVVGSTGPEVVHDLAIAPNGDVLIAGYYDEAVDFDPGSGTAELESPACFDAFVARYSSGGDYLWAARMGGDGGCAEANAYALAVDADHNVYVVGYFFNHSGFEVDFDPGAQVFPLPYAGEEDGFVARLDSLGNLDWAIAINSQFSVFASGIALYGNDEILVSGKACGTVDFDPGTPDTSIEGGCNLYLARYNNHGAVLTHVEPVTSAPTKGVTMDIFPNPAASSATTMLSSNVSDDVRIALYDLSGAHVKTVYEGPILANVEYALRISGENLAAGVYLARVEGSRIYASRKIVFIRGR